MVKKGMKEALEAFVKKGGVLVLTYMSGLVNESDNVYPGGYPGPLRELAGVWVEEIDALAPEQSNDVIFTDGTKAKCGLVCDLMHLEGAQSLGEYGSDFYAKRPAVTKNSFGEGAVYYIGTRMETAGLDKVMETAVRDAAVKPVMEGADGLEVTCRKADDCSYYFVINFKDEPLLVPAALVGNRDMLTGREVEGGEMLSKYDVKIIKVVE